MRWGSSSSWAAVVVGSLAFMLGPLAPGAAAGPPGELTETDLVLVDTASIDARLRELTFTTPAVVGETRVRVLLPAGYDADPGRRYPVLYLLHGGTGGYLDWTTQGDAATITEDFPLIVVMPDSGPGGGYLDWWNNGAGGPPMWETYHLDQLVPWIDEHYRTTGSRDGRAIAGLSMGGGGAMHYAARRPDLFTGAAAFSGAVDTNTVPVQVLVQMGGLEEGKPFAVSGPRLTEEVRWRGHNPWDLARNLEGLFLQLDTGNGSPGGPGGDTGDPIETACWQMMTNLHDELTRLGYPHVWNDYGAGGHAWFYWQRDLTELLPRLMERFAEPAPPPQPFGYTSIDPDFDVWGWSVSIDRPALEFSTIEDAGPSGFRLTGSGDASVTTAPLHQPGERYAVRIVDADGERTVDVAADESGRLTVPVSLGPGNPEQQYSPQGVVWALAQGAAPGTWPSVTATVEITPVRSASEAVAAAPTTPAEGRRTLPATGGNAAVLLAGVAVVAGALAVRRTAISR